LEVGGGGERERKKERENKESNPSSKHIATLKTRKRERETLLEKPNRITKPQDD
jgi:hypothetical protein